MEFNTIKGFTYCVTAQTDTTVTDSDGLSHTVKAGDQWPFVANSDHVTYTGDCQITQIRGNFNIASTEGGGGGGGFDGHLNANFVIGHGLSGTKAEWSVPLGNIWHQGRLDEETTGYSVLEGVDIPRTRTVDDIVNDINLRSPLKFIVEAVKVSDSEIKLVAAKPGTAANAYTFTASGGDPERPIDDPCFGNGQLERTVNGTVAVPASTYTAERNGESLLSVADVDIKPKAYSGNPVSSGGVFDALYGKQDKLTFDDYPRYMSQNPVKSSGLYPTPLNVAVGGIVEFPMSQDILDPGHKKPFMHPNTLYIVWDNDLDDRSATVVMPENLMPDYFATVEMHVFNHQTTPVAIQWPSGWYWYDEVSGEYRKDTDSHTYSPSPVGNSCMCVSVRNSVDRGTMFDPHVVIVPHVLAKVEYTYTLSDTIPGD